jgi:hypothetical protein
MPKPDEVVGSVGPYTIFRKSDSREYEIVGPAVQNSPLAYTMIRVSSETLGQLGAVVRCDVRKNKRG